MNKLNKLMIAVLVGSNVMSGAPVFAGEIELSQIKSNGDVAIKLHLLDCGDLEIRDGSVMNPNIAKGTVQSVANTCYLISHPKGDFLWDAGIPDEVINMPDGVEAGGGLFLMKVRKTLESQLAELNIVPKDVDYIAFSHLHGDHTGNAKLFSNATWLVQENEFDLGFTDNAVAVGFAPDDYSNLIDNVQKLNGHYDVFDDGSVVIVSTPGHTVGHQVLFVNLPKTKPVLLSGDLYTSLLSYEDGSMPAWNSSPEQTLESFKLVDSLLEKTGAALWVQHDNGQYESLNKAPYAYE